MESILKNDRGLNMLLMFEQGIRGEICQAMLRYATANIICMKNYNKNVASSLLQHLDANNLHEWAMSKKLPVGEFNWIHPEDYTEDFIKGYNDNDEIGAMLRVDIEYRTMIRAKHRDLPFLPERRKINKIEKLVATIDDKEK